MDAYRPLLIAGLVVTEVAIWQWRMVIAHRGSRVSAMLLGIVGAVLQITAITQVVADVSDPAGVIAYAVGVGFGVLLGLVAGERLTPGMIGVTIVTKAPHLARSLWDRGWPVTAQSGHAENGPVTILSVPVNRRDEARLHRDVQSIAPDAVCNTRDLRAPNPAIPRPAEAVARPSWHRQASPLAPPRPAEGGRYGRGAHPGPRMSPSYVKRYRRRSASPPYGVRAWRRSPRVPQFSPRRKTASAAAAPTGPRHGAISPETSPTSQTYRARLQRALVSPADQIVPRH